jgi:hypothetical protein
VSAKGKAVATAALDILLRKAERAWARQAPKTQTLRFSEASFAEYFKLPMWQDKAAAHAELRNAERDGALSIEWERRAGEDGQVERITLVDADAVARIIGETPAWAEYDHAEALLHAWRKVPNAQQILERWRAGKQVRGQSPARVADFVDACRVIEARSAQSADEDVLIRRFSARLFSDSKRIENIGPALDALTAESLDTPWREVDDVFSGLGLIKMPQPILLAGAGVVELFDGTRLPIAAPYMGLAPQSIRRIELPDDAAYVLTIENLTTFHEIAMGKAGKPSGLIIYTAGMPSPALRRVYGPCLECALADGHRSRLHWGDIDLGGFRIAAYLARAHASPLGLWAMDPAQHPDAMSRKTLSSDELREITRIATRHGWEDIAERVVVDKRAIEQEAVMLELPC